jgi:hypothetical protein
LGCQLPRTVNSIACDLPNNRKFHKAFASIFQDSLKRAKVMSANHRSTGPLISGPQSEPHPGRQVIRRLALQIIVLSLFGAIVAHYMGPRETIFTIAPAAWIMLIGPIEYLWEHRLQPRLKRLGFTTSGDVLVLWVLFVLFLGTIIGVTLALEIKN